MRNSAEVFEQRSEGSPLPSGEILQAEYGPQDDTLLRSVLPSVIPLQRELASRQTVRPGYQPPAYDILLS